MRGDRHSFKKCWASAPEELKFVADRFEGRVLHLCAGESLIGDVNVDREPRLIPIDPSRKSVVREDVLSPEFDLGEKFDTVVSDPPWNWPYDKRVLFHGSVARHLKKGGLFILHAPWIPNYAFTVEEVYIAVTRGGFPKNVAPLSFSRYTGDFRMTKRSRRKIA